MKVNRLCTRPNGYRIQLMELSGRPWPWVIGLERSNEVRAIQEFESLEQAVGAYVLVSLAPELALTAMWREMGRTISEGSKP